MNTTAFNQKNLISGIIAGVIGGVASGFMIMRVHKLEQIGAMIGMPYPLSGFLFHLFCTAILGLIFAIVFYKLAKDFFSTTLWGIGYGVILWVLLTLIVARTMMGEAMVFNMDTVCNTKHMLFTHLVFGLVMGVSYYNLRHSRQ